MCSVLLLHRVLEDSALTVFFVRDEEHARRGLPPGRLAFPAGAVAPTDPRAGGTWFGFAAGGFLAGLVNRPEDAPRPDARSRGWLLRDALAAPTAAEALRTAAQSAEGSPHAGCRLFAGDGATLLWMECPAGAPAGPARPLTPGSWLLRHRQPPAPAPIEIAAAAGEGLADWWRRLAAVLAVHGPAEAPLCRHEEQRGSVDTTLAALDVRGRPWRLLHRCGPPCGGGLEDHSHLLKLAPLGGGPTEEMP